MLLFVMCEINLRGPGEWKLVICYGSDACKVNGKNFEGMLGHYKLKSVNVKRNYKAEKEIQYPHQVSSFN